jgi:WD40 repeat protein/biotin carboxyl carrier protein
MWRVVYSVVFLAALIGLTCWWARGHASRVEGEGVMERLPSTVSQRVGKPSVPGHRVSSQPRLDLAGGTALYDPVVVGPCHLVAAEEQDVSSQTDGVLEEVLADLGQPVRGGQLLARLDDRLLRPQIELLRIKAASEAAKLIAKAQYEEVEMKASISERLLAKGVSPSTEYKTLARQRERCLEELKKAEEEQEVARKELEKALRVLEVHSIRAGISGEITRVYRRKGESVRQMEPLFSIANVNRLRIEGLCKVQQAKLLHVGMRALVEPEVRGEQMTELTGHTAAVTGLAVSPDGRLVAAASTDRTVLLWHWPGGTRSAVLAHPVEVDAVAFAPRDPSAASPAGYRLLTGGADGRVRLWTISDSGEVGEPVVLRGTHGSAVRALACSPDGKFCASGGEDRRLGIWDVSAGKHLYWLRGQDDSSESAHQGAVTAVHFTPDNHLISAGRDNVLAVWGLGESGADLVTQFAGRSGDAPQLGISPDGSRLLFDNGEELRLLDWQAGNWLGSLRGRRQGRFQGFALFSPGGDLIATVSDNTRIQVWTVPAPPETARFLRQAYARGFQRNSLLTLGALGDVLTPAGFMPTWAVVGAPGSRSQGTSEDKESGILIPHLWDLDGRELRHFIPPNPGNMTCGAFAPNTSVLFTGGSDKVVRVWEVPAAAERRHLLEASITYVGSQVERGTDMVRVRAELENPVNAALRLQAGTYSYLRLYPETERNR